MKKPSISSVNESILTEEDVYKYPSDYTDDFEEYTSRDDSREMIKKQVKRDFVSKKQRNPSNVNNDSGLGSQEESLVCLSVHNSRLLPEDLGYVNKDISKNSHLISVSPDNKPIFQKKLGGSFNKPAKAKIPEGFRSPYIDKKSKSKHSQETTASNTFLSIAEERPEPGLDSKKKLKRVTPVEKKPKIKDLGLDVSNEIKTEGNGRALVNSGKTDTTIKMYSEEDKTKRSEANERKFSVKLKDQTAFEFFSRLYPNFPEVLSPVKLDNPVKKQRESAQLQSSGTPFVYENEKMKKIYSNNMNLKQNKVKEPRGKENPPQELRNPQSAPCLNDYEDDFKATTDPKPQKRYTIDQKLHNLNNLIKVEKREIVINYNSKKWVSKTNNFSETVCNPVETERYEASGKNSRGDAAPIPKIGKYVRERKKSQSGRDTPSNTAAENNKEQGNQNDVKLVNKTIDPSKKISKPFSQQSLQTSPENPLKPLLKQPEKPRTSYILPDTEELSKVTAQGWALVERKTFQLISGRNIHKKKEIASLTKMMTCLVVCQLSRKLGLNLEKTCFQISRHASNMIGTSAELKEGDVVSITDLLYGMMLPSGNDAAYALSENFGSYLYQEAVNGGKIQQTELRRKSYVEYFVDEMNDQAKRLKMYNTFFANSHGLTNEQNRSTPYDIARLSIHLLQNEFICSIVNKKFHNTKIEEADRSIRSCCWENTNKLLFHEGIYGIKTGNTDTAGACLSTSYRKKDIDIVIVVLGCTTREDRFEDTLTVIDWYYNKKQSIKQINE